MRRETMRPSAAGRGTHAGGAGTAGAILIEITL